VTAGFSRHTLIRFGAFAAAAAFVPVPARAEIPRIALVHTQAAGDDGPIDGMIASLKRIARERAIPVRAVYASDAASYQPILELLGESGVEVVLVTFPGMTQPLSAVAPAFPKTRFVHLYGDPMRAPLANVRTVAYETHLASYLSGMCGASVSRASKIGYIGGMSMPTLDASVNALDAGAKSVRAVELSAAFVGSFQDPVKALAIAEQMFGAGVDYIQAEGSASDLGVIQSANARLGRLVSGGSRPEFPLGTVSIAAITLCDFERSLYQQATLALNNAWTPGHYRSGLQDGVVDFVPSPLFLANGPSAVVRRFRAMWPAVVAAKSRIITGAVKVPFKPNLG
jgi:basic membrane protein A and related proteins